MRSKKNKATMPSFRLNAISSSSEEANLSKTKSRMRRSSTI